ncbi:MAG TPA: hypothetical protein VNF00_05955 [Candidatus Acidoferrales bacterium]|nr:hypothetical protein [Candidatus Acidoferrales bacterium]
MRIPGNKKKRLILFALSMALLLMMATTAGNLWHHHATAAAESACPICHLGHQPVQQPAVMQSTPVMLAVSSGPSVAEPLFRAGPIFSRLATRAPPSL